MDWWKAGEWSISSLTRLTCYFLSYTRLPIAKDVVGSGLDLILMPGMLSLLCFIWSANLDLRGQIGVAFDRSLSRLGYGKGYYDRFLTSYTSPPGESPREKPILCNPIFLLCLHALTLCFVFPQSD